MGRGWGMESCGFPIPRSEAPAYAAAAGRSYGVVSP